MASSSRWVLSLVCVGILRSRAASQKKITLPTQATELALGGETSVQEFPCRLLKYGRAHKEIELHKGDRRLWDIMSQHDVHICSADSQVVRSSSKQFTVTAEAESVASSTSSMHLISKWLSSCLVLDILYCLGITTIDFFFLFSFSFSIHRHNTRTCPEYVCSS